MPSGRGRRSEGRLRAQRVLQVMHEPVLARRSSIEAVGYCLEPRDEIGADLAYGEDDDDEDQGRDETILDRSRSGPIAHEAPKDFEHRRPPLRIWLSTLQPEAGASIEQPPLRDWRPARPTRSPPTGTWHSGCRRPCPARR